eukprot:PhM_4_TR17389/c3_g3_i10/m.32985
MTTCSPTNVIHEPEPLSSTKTTISTGSQTAAQSSDTPIVFGTTADTTPDGDVLAVRRRGVLYTASAYSKPVRIEYNMSVDIEHTCEETPCPFARPIQVLRTASRGAATRPCVKNRTKSTVRPVLARGTTTAGITSAATTSM